MNIWDLTVKVIKVPYNAFSKVSELFFEKVFAPFWIYIAYKHFKVTFGVMVCLYAWVIYQLIFG